MYVRICYTHSIISWCKAIIFSLCPSFPSLVENIRLWNNRSPWLYARECIQCLEAHVVQYTFNKQFIWYPHYNLFESYRFGEASHRQQRGYVYLPLRCLIPGKQKALIFRRERKHLRRMGWDDWLIINDAQHEKEPVDTCWWCHLEAWLISWIPVASLPNHKEHCKCFSVLVSHEIIEALDYSTTTAHDHFHGQVCVLSRIDEPKWRQQNIEHGWHGVYWEVRAQGVWRSLWRG